MTAEEVARVLGARRVGEGRWMARCPAHEDRRDSLSIRDGGDKVLLHCFAGCPTEAVLAAAGLTWADLFADARGWRRANGYRTRRPTRAAVVAPRRDVGGRADAKLREFREREAQRLADEILERYQVITHAERILEQNRDDEAGWQLLGEGYRGLAELEWLADLLNSRNPSNWLMAKRFKEGEDVDEAKL